MQVVNRRQCLRAATLAVGSLAVLLSAMPANGAAPMQQSATPEVAAPQVPAAPVSVAHVPIDVTVTQGTNMSVAVSPGNRELAFDLQGNIWTLPARGGRAHRITAIDMESRFPQWSGDGRRIVFQCYRDNQWQVCIADRDGSHLEQVTAGASDHREPTFAPDGRHVLYVCDEGGHSDVWETSLGDGATRRLTQASVEHSYPQWSPQGDRFAYISQNKNDSHLGIRTTQGEERVVASVSGANHLLLLPSWNPSGTAIAYVDYDRAANTSSMQLVDLATGGSRRLVGAAEDISATRVAWIDDNSFIYSSDGLIRRGTISGRGAATIPFVAMFALDRHVYAPRPSSVAREGVQRARGILRPHVSPDGRFVVFAALSDLWLLKIGDPVPRRLTNDTAVDADPVFSPDGRQIAFTSDARESGTMDLCLLDLRTGDRRIIASPGESVTLPDFSPDGRKVAFLVANSANWHDRYLEILELETGQTRRWSEPLFHPSRPSWSADSQFLALSSLEQSSPRFRRGLNEILLVKAADFSSRFLDPVPGRSLGMRGADGPEWSPDGRRLAFILDGEIWTLPVTKAAEAGGSPLRIAGGTADSISWTSDSNTMVFLHDGDLQQVDTRTGEVGLIPLTLTWKPQMPAGRMVIRAGRLFDARSTTYRTNIDIVIDQRRITALLPAGTAWGSDVRVIDASRSTVIPGLIESHIHNFPMNGEATGRMFLSFGVTSLREVGTDPYDGLEARESWASGARPGPHDFYSGLLEGGQVFYPMSLAISSPAHLSQELGRIAALDYDLVKTYDRLTELDQARVIAFAHARGLTVTSHNLWPAVGFGADAVEHLSTQARREISDRQSFRGNVYDDVLQLLSRSGVAITTTAFAFDAGLERPEGTLTDSPPELLQLRNLLPLRYRELLKSMDQRAQGAEQQSRQRAREAVSQQFIARLREHGITVIPGTDTSFFLAGLSLVREMIAVHRAGLPMGEVLQATTRDAARVLGVSADLGTLEPGRLADLVIIDGDPLRVPSDLVNVALVVKDGVTYTQEDLLSRGPHPAFR